jgi:hypothetical protein
VRIEISTTNKFASSTNLDTLHPKMKSLFVALFMAFLAQISIVCATDLSSPNKIAHLQNTYKPFDDIQHLECQLKISRQHEKLNALQEKVRPLSEAFEHDLYLLNQNTLEALTQIHKELTQPKVRSTCASWTLWAPKSPIKRFVHDGQAFLKSLTFVEFKALDLWGLHYNIKDCMWSLEESCQGKSGSCAGIDVRMRSALELKACGAVEALDGVALLGAAWFEVWVDLAKSEIALEKIWGLVLDAQAEKEKVSEEWVANVVAKWIAILEDLLVRTGKRSGPAGSTPITSLPLPLFYKPLRAMGEQFQD